MTKHSKKVVSIEIDPQTSTIYTCAKDNKLILTSLNQSTSELEIDGEIVLLKSDFLHEIIILATKADGILVFNSINMHQIRVIQTQFNVFTMSISQNSFIFIGLETGDLEVYNESSLLNTLKTKTEIKCIIYIGNRDEIFIGDEAGNINIWNRGKGVLCFI